MNKIIIAKKKPKLTTIRISVSLLKDVKDAAKGTEYEGISKQGLVALATRRFILSLNPAPPTGADDADAPIIQEEGF